MNVMSKTNQKQKNTNLNIVLSCDKCNNCKCKRTIIIKPKNEIEQFIYWGFLNRIILEQNKKGKKVCSYE